MKKYFKIVLLAIASMSLLSCSSYTTFTTSCINTDTTEKLLIGQSKDVVSKVIKEKPVSATPTTWNYHYYETHKENRFRPGLSITTLQYNPYYGAYRTVTQQITPDQIYQVDITSQYDGTICFENGYVSGVVWRGREPNTGEYGMLARKTKLLLYTKEDNLRAYKHLLQVEPEMNGHAELVYATVEAAKHSSTHILRFLVEEKNISLDEECITWAYGENYDYVAVKTSARKIINEVNSPTVMKWLEEMKAKAESPR